MNEMINVLDKGYVRLVNVMGSDLSVVNSARVSYDKESTELSEKDARLIRFLAREGHTSPFRHATLQFEMYAPLMVARQHWKYIVGSDHTMDAWNESSRRYVTEEPAFYIPEMTNGGQHLRTRSKVAVSLYRTDIEYHEKVQLQTI
jgi:thymidylate synthase (FAD)